MLLKTEVWYDKILTHKPMPVHSGLSFYYNAVHCVQKTNVRNSLHMYRFLMMESISPYRSRHIFQGHVMSCRWHSHVWKKAPIITVSISV